MGRIKKFNKYIDECFNEAAKNAAKDLNYQLEVAFEKAVEAFYDDPAFNGTNVPKYYKRTYSTFYASNLYDRTNKEEYFEPIKTGTGYQTSFSLGYDVFKSRIGSDVYRADDEWVLGRTFEKGIHGVTEYEKKKFGQNEYWLRKNGYYIKDLRRNLKILRGRNLKGNLKQWLKTMDYVNNKTQKYYKRNQYKKYRNILDFKPLMGEARQMEKALYFASSKDRGDLLTNASMTSNLNGKVFTLPEDIHGGFMKKPPKILFEKQYRRFKTKKYVNSLVSGYIIKALMKG